VLLLAEKTEKWFYFSPNLIKTGNFVVNDLKFQNF